MYKNLSKSKEKFMEEKIVKILLENSECEAIVLFGSYARNTQNAESDIDVAIKVKEKKDKKELYILSNMLADELNK